MGGRWLVTWLVVVVLVGLVPASTYASSLVNMEFKDAPLVDVFHILGEMGEMNVLVDPSVTGHVSLYLKELTVAEGLDLVSRISGYRYQIVGNTLVVATEERLREEFAAQDFDFVQLRRADMRAAETLLGLIVPNIRYFADEPRRMLVLYGTSQDLRLAKELLRQYEAGYPEEAPAPVVTPSERVDSVPPTPEEPKVETFHAQVVDGDGPRIVEYLEMLYPETTIHWNAAFRTIVVSATFDAWTTMQETIEAQDVPHVTVRGIVHSGGTPLALVDYNNQSLRIREEQTLGRWTVLAIDPEKVTFGYQDREFKAVLRR